MAIAMGYSLNSNSSVFRLYMILNNWIFVKYFCSNKNMLIYVYIRIHIHTHIYSYIYIYIYVCVCVWVCIVCIILTDLYLITHLYGTWYNDTIPTWYKEYKENNNNIVDLNSGEPIDERLSKTRTLL